MKDQSIILSVKNLSVDFPVKGGLPFAKKKYVQAVTDVSLDIIEGETFGVVGESGCGKSTLANAMIGMIRPTKGEVFFKNQSLFELDRKSFIETRRHMQMIFQDPYSSLNPRWNVFQIISEPMYIRGGYTEDEMKIRVLELLKLVGLDENDLYRNPSDFSGGQRQRIGIARAIILNPDFLVCDEPVSALDVSVHAQILNLLIEIQKKLNLTYVFISHNLAVVKCICDNMIIMYLGNVVESGKSSVVFKNPQHPYTHALLSAVLDMNVDKNKKRTILKGDIPSPIDPPKGCRFWQRCPFAMVGCKDHKPDLIEIEKDHQVACFKVTGFSQEQIEQGFDQLIGVTVLTDEKSE
ncbi:ABC transporter ATP-binding protein [Peloplasma aerotolerans]|jgi:oligopeptide/dipeptide ABC transporter ATP-binding protein|uniref:ATP-binding cassette domain-containing protein n=1 Tax=Peloplasma aerotolerans TaxID=3044389 RepID=A0AAW6U3U9_9MOLU|nr:oligopeptide/dipeptide ABC transporter ATP-binding protein [Mariniplasma sp. M4Ah]MDI6452572.1 ATP-binding cassette domain-containing protein [Mariniplasma sp. M4Ah]